MDQRVINAYMSRYGSLPPGLEEQYAPATPAPSEPFRFQIPGAPGGGEDGTSLVKGMLAKKKTSAPAEEAAVEPQVTIEDLSSM